MSGKTNLNVFKYTDYGDPVIYQNPDYRTANAIAHRFCQPQEKNFVPARSHILCEELKTAWSDYRPRSESSKEFSWKINPNRNHREDLAPALSGVQYLHQFSDKVKANGPIFPIKNYKNRFTFDASLPREPKIVTVEPPKIQQIWKETHFTDTDGYFPFADKLLSTTELDFHLHSNYSTARTNLIVRNKPPFNCDEAFFIPKSKLLNENPLHEKYLNLNMRDVAKFTPPSYDRIIPNRSRFVKNFGLTTEMSSKY